MYHYLNSSKEPQGPFTLHQLRELEAKGLIGAHTLVAAAGDSKWRTWREVSSGFSASTTAGPSSHSTAESGIEIIPIGSLNQRFEGMLASLYGSWPASKAAVSAEFNRLLTSWNYVLRTGILVAGAIASVLFFVAAFRQDSTHFIFFGVVALPAFFVLQYVVSLFAAANVRLLNGPPITLFSMALPKSLVAAGTFALVCCGLGGTAITTISFAKSLSAGLTSLGLWLAVLFILIFACWVASRCCEVLNVRSVPTGQQNAADYFANLVRLVGRFLLALTPLIGALAATFLIIVLLGVGAQLVTDDQQNVMFQLFGGAIFTILLAALCIVFLLPLIAHLAYIAVVTASEVVAAFFRLVHDNGRMAAGLPDNKSS